MHYWKSQQVCVLEEQREEMRKGLQYVGRNKIEWIVIHNQVVQTGKIRTTRYFEYQVASQVDKVQRLQSSE